MTHAYVGSEVRKILSRFSYAPFSFSSKVKCGYYDHRHNILTMKLVWLSLGLLLSPTTFAFAPAAFVPTSTARSTFKLAAAPAKEVWILKTEADVTQAVHKIVEDAASKAIGERGHFALAIPGGSVLKVLSSLDAGDWVSKTTLAYVNHKCVPNDDLSSAIHAKLRRKMKRLNLSVISQIILIIFWSSLLPIGQEHVSRSLGLV